MISFYRPPTSISGFKAQIAQINERSAITETSDSWYGEGAHAWMSQGQSITWKKQQEKFDTECHAKCE